MPEPEISFTYDSTGRTFRFRAQTEENLEYWHWDFGDMTGASPPVTSRTYALPGTYVVRLRGTNDPFFETYLETSQEIAVP